MALKGVVRGEKRPPRVLLYGPPGIGKSTFGSESEAPIFVTTEDGVDNLPVDQFPRAESYDALLENVSQVAKDRHDYKTLVVDTLNGASELCAQKVCEEQFGGVWYTEKGKKGFTAFAQGWQSTSEEMRSLLALLDECRNARDMQVILLAHVGLHTVSHPTDGDYTKFAPEMDKRVWARWSKWCDIILRADFDYYVKPGETGKKGRAELGDTTRWLFSVGNAAQDCKTRVGYEMPERMLLSYPAFHEAIEGGDTSACDEVRRLWGLLDKDAETKALKYLGVNSVKDLDGAERTKVRATLNRLRQIDAERANAEPSEDKEVVA